MKRQFFFFIALCLFLNIPVMAMDGEVSKKLFDERRNAIGGLFGKGPVHDPKTGRFKEKKKKEVGVSSLASSVDVASSVDEPQRKAGGRNRKVRRKGRGNKLTGRLARNKESLAGLLARRHAVTVPVSDAMTSTVVTHNSRKVSETLTSDDTANKPVGQLVDSGWWRLWQGALCLATLGQFGHIRSQTTSGLDNASAGTAVKNDTVAAFSPPTHNEKGVPFAWTMKTNLGLESFLTQAQYEKLSFEAKGRCSLIEQ